MPKLGPYSDCSTLAKLDGRTKEARLLKSLRTELVQHVGGKPSSTQRLLIDQAVQLQLRLALMDAEDTGNGAMSDRNARQYLAWANSFSRLLRQLGLKGPAQQQPTLRDHLAAKASAKQ